MTKVAVGLLHYPIYDRSKNVVATNITNLDIHDIARVTKVYGLDRYFIIHPAAEQLMFVERLLDHWRIGDGGQANPLRASAMDHVRTAESIDHVKRLWLQDEALGSSEGKVEVIGTTARNIPGVERIGFRELQKEIQAGDLSKRLLLLFGTGFGMTDETLKSCDRLLEPLKGAPPLDYRHLSVRSAVSICLDRLLASW